MPKKTCFFLILLFLIILLSSFVFAQPPFETQVASGTIGLDIRVPVVQYIMQNQEGITLHTHVFNKSDGVMLTPLDSDIGCYLHLYGTEGQHTLEEELTGDSNNLEWRLEIGSGNFSTIGKHSLILWCNNSNMGGFVSEGFEITESGEAEDNTNENQLLFYFILIVIVGLLIFGFFKEDSTLVATAGIFMTLFGLYVFNNGFSFLNNQLTQTLAIIFAIIGAYIFLRVLMEEGIVNLNNWG